MLTKISKLRRFFAVLFLACLLASFSVYYFRPGVEVTLQNMSRTGIHDVVIHVSGNAYSLPAMASNAYASTTVIPKSESSLEIEYKDIAGKQYRLKTDLYLEPSNRGTINLKLKEGRMSDIELKVK